MFVLNREVLKCRKITFSIIEEYLVYFTGLQPDIVKIGEDVKINFKQTNRKIFIYITNKLLFLVCGYKRKVRTIRKASYAVKNIAMHTNLYNVLELKKKLEKKASEKPEEDIETAKGEKIRKSDYINNYINSSYKNILEFIYWTEDQFVNNIGFLEYEEVLALLERKKLERNLVDVSNLLLVAGACLSKSSDLNKHIKTLQGRIKELTNIGFDKEAFDNDIMYGLGGYDGEEI
jgi:hypothetical protein